MLEQEIVLYEFMCGIFVLDENFLGAGNRAAVDIHPKDAGHDFTILWDVSQPIYE